MEPLLTTNSNIKCLHGGTADLSSTHSKLSVDGYPVLMETDIHPVKNCIHSVGSISSPCINVKWSQGATKLSIGGIPVLLKSSAGDCVNNLNLSQGAAQIIQTQSKAKAR